MKSYVNPTVFMIIGEWVIRVSYFVTSRGMKGILDTYLLVISQLTSCFKKGYLTMVSIEGLDRQEWKELAFAILGIN